MLTPPRPPETGAFLVLAVIDLVGANLDALEEYESAVLPLVGLHGGGLLRRLRSRDASMEAHLLQFPSQEQFQKYLADPSRLELAGLLTQTRAKFRVFEVNDVV